MKIRRFPVGLALFTMALVIGLAMQIALLAPTARRVPYSEVVAEAQLGHLAEVEIGGTEIRALLTEAAANEKGVRWIAAARLPGIDDGALIADLQARGVRVSGRPEGSAWAAAAAWMMPVALLVLLYLWARRGAEPARGALTFAKSRARIVDRATREKVTFDDVAGVDEAEAELVEVVDFLKDPQRYQRLGGHIPKGVLLVGPPGTGKTLLARAVAGEAAVPFFSISGSEFVEMFVGVGAARVRDLFEEAKRRAPCIVFIDELDSVGKSRSNVRGLMANEEREQTLNQLLAEMDGFDATTGVILLAATNAPESLDPALLRAGRFDRQVVVDRPDLQGRVEILRVHVRGVTLDPAVDVSVVAARTPGMVGADLANIVNEAALLAARRGADAVAMRDFEEAIDRVTLGLEKKSRLMTGAEKERVAQHESGHALVALSLPLATPVHRVSIIPRSVGALGHTLQLPTQERYLLTLPELEDQLAVMLAGRAAEELAYQGAISTGAADDLDRASELARQMATRFGMTERLGHVTYGHGREGRFLPSLFHEEERGYSETTARVIDEEVRRIVDEAYARARAVLASRRADLARVAAALALRETLTRAELDAVLAGGERRALTA
jgi:cell division protease FtsH